MSQTLEYIIRRFRAYGLEFKYSDGSTYDWCTLLLALELECNKSVNYSTGKTPSMLEKGWNPIPPAETLRKDPIDIHPTVSGFKIMLYKVQNHAKEA
ncbi:hypothetical protein O181_099128 [Austropuccinia psidii MF-1]|uniref:Uncharacterized protein n=1 Tax=Austropuccinia psidii MF-1 TaxID=1389203 RepID=A0A9Q3PEU5_9BASI|nr:hypothetical protein [Austropuccinia psidii MF-1]